MLHVWDLPTRVFHWSLAACVVASLLSAHLGGNAMPWHFRFGYLTLALLAFRGLWGLLGGHWSRFTAFSYGPRDLWRYLRGTRRPHDEVGHSPLGSLSVWALLTLLLVQVATGLVADDEIANTGPLNRFAGAALAARATRYHAEFGQWLLVGLVLLHVAAVLFYLLGRRRNLILPMWRGDKPMRRSLLALVPPSKDTAATRALALGLFLLCAAGVAGLVWLGG